MTRPLLLLLATLSLLVLASGCATRTVRHTIEENNTLVVSLVREVRGFSVQQQGFEHPAVISAVRLERILGAIEVEMRTDAGVVRQPGIPPEIVNKVSVALSAALEQASPDEAVAVKAIRKQAKLGIFNNKFLTTFLAHVQNDQLYIALRRIDWPLPSGAEYTKTKNVLPDPIRDRRSMDFRVVTGEPIYFAGPQDLEIDWRSKAFQTAFRLPGSTEGRKRRREVLESSRVPREEFAPEPGEAAEIEQLSPEQLRALADLEEDRREGRITETVYQRERRQLLRRR